MKAFLQHKKKVILFLSTFFVVGIIIGTVRNDTLYLSPNSTHNEIPELRYLSQTVYNVNMYTKSSESISVYQGLINKYGADKDELITLLKNYSVTYERIIKYREYYGKFSLVNYLKNIKRIGKNPLI